VAGNGNYLFRNFVIILEGDGNEGSALRKEAVGNAYEN
jgi:hypothetical protein